MGRLVAYAGEKVLGKTMISIVRPSSMPKAKQQAPTKSLVDLLS